MSLSLERYFLKLSYCGSAYNGWQNQPHKGTVSVQGMIETAMTSLLREKIDIVGCGRTDTGVHARDYFAHFDFYPGIDKDTLLYRLNKMLPEDITVHDIIPVDRGAHARFDAVSRSYEYNLHISKSPFANHSFYYAYGVPDIDILNEAASLIMEYEDFSTFCKLNSDVQTKFCKVRESRWVRQNDQFTYYVTSDRFLRGMIRLIVGMCLNVARGKLSLDEVHNALINKERTGHDWTVPAKGLFLCNVKYAYINM